MASVRFDSSGVNYHVLGSVNYLKKKVRGEQFVISVWADTVMIFPSLQANFLNVFPIMH